MNQPMRILQVTGPLDIGGIENLLLNLHRAIDKEEIQFDYISHSNAEGFHEEEIKKLGGNVYHCPRYSGVNHFDYLHWWSDFFNSHKEYKIIHSHIRSTASLFLPIAKQHGLHTIVHSHSTATDGKGISFLLRTHNQKKLENMVEYRFACSDSAGKWLFPTKEFYILKNAIDTETYKFNEIIREQIRTEYKFKSEDIVIGTVGRYDPRKNPEGIMEIFSNCHDLSDKFKLLWVGCGEKNAEAERFLEDKNISAYSILTEKRNDVYRLLQAIDIFILPSFSEGLGLSAIEAQAAGLPCFLSDTIPHEVKITELCRFLPLGDYKHWAEEICKTDISNRHDTSKQIISAGYDIHTTAKWLEDFYLKIANER